MTVPETPAIRRMWPANLLDTVGSPDLSDRVTSVKYPYRRDTILRCDPFQ